MMRVSVETITPQLARAYLEMSAGNRPLKDAKVAAYMRDMAAGKWRANGESIIFDEVGLLIDGHHRLTACIKADATFQSVVVRGIGSEARKTIDMGASRTIGDALSFHGYKNANAVNAIALALMSLRNGRPKSANPSAAEVFDFVKSYPLVVDAAVVASRKHLPRSQAICGAIWFVAALNGEADKAEAFLDVLATGIPSGPGCPAHALRERFTRDALAQKPTSQQEKHRLIVSAWERFARGETAKTIKPMSEYRITGWPLKTTIAAE